MKNCVPSAIRPVSCCSAAVQKNCETTTAPEAEPASRESCYFPHSEVKKPSLINSCTRPLS